LSQRRKSPSVDLSGVERLADLSRLSLSTQEVERLRGELSSILEYFATLDKVDVSKIQAGRSEDEGQGLREDAARPSTPQDVLAGVPQKKGRYVKAPRVF
jgi:aspartyl-tRNA(Asn)/glutamyl-tRNA(Gln) amidotransferase subunit C